MSKINMSGEYSPRLVTLEGDGCNCGLSGADPLEIAVAMGVDFEDAEILTGDYMTPEQMRYLDKKYPEYMGIWPILAKIGIGIAKGVTGIVKAVKKKKAAKKAASNVAKDKKTEEARIAEERRLQLLREAKAEADRKAEQKKMMLMIGVPVLGLAALMLMKKK